MLSCAELNWTDRDFSPAYPWQQIRRAIIPKPARPQSANVVEPSSGASGIELEWIGANTSASGVFENVDVRTIPQTYANLASTFIYAWSAAGDPALAATSGLVSVDAPFEAPITICLVPPYFGRRVRPNAEYVARLSRALFQTLLQEPVLHGFDHPGEPILEKMFHEYPADSADWVISCLSNSETSSRAADVLRLLCRFEPNNEGWRHELVSQALKSPSIEIRDAGIHAIEWWNTPDMLHLLRSHKEPVTWLRAYARQVLADNEG